MTVEQHAEAAANDLWKRLVEESPPLNRLTRDERKAILRKHVAKHTQAAIDEALAEKMIGVLDSASNHVHEVDLLRQRIAELSAENSRMCENATRANTDRVRVQDEIQKQNHEVCQTLGKALHYAWFKDDQANFPGATEADGVCVGDHVAETLAVEASKRIAALEGLGPLIEDAIRYAVTFGVCTDESETEAESAKQLDSIELEISRILKGGAK